MPEDMRKRTPAAIVQAVNTALRTDAAKAARRLNSGDTVITFNSQATQFTAETEWVQAAFGEKASLTPRIYSVVVKAVSRDLARDYDDLKKSISQANGIKVLKVKAMRPRSEGATRLNLILGLASPEEANSLCRNDVYIDAQVFRFEPYEESLQPRQCYQCFQFGHTARHCRATTRCGHCAAAAHPDGEGSCPVKSGAKAKCVLCNGAHAAWARSCPVAKGHWDQARDAYQYRPAFFDVREQVAGPPRGRAATPPACKKRGRPLGSANRRLSKGPPSSSGKISTQTRLTQMLGGSSQSSTTQVPPPQVDLTMQIDDSATSSQSNC